ncbi:HxlR family transcriptional regulator [Burkholderia diffusa]|uniref:winged helix-turn-helix transcriptional regulator n=1 Tax=Burkholderia sp. RF2-non_BP3 TaxID=1637844 RepID=UPI001CB31DC2|nr:HxlR family transcriptional regulator [Burkholderia diffusa]
MEAAMRLLGGRWRRLLVSYLLDGPKRFSDLRRDMVMREFVLWLKARDAHCEVEAETALPQ